jgi:hypothetical protein
VTNEIDWDAYVEDEPQAYDENAYVGQPVTTIDISSRLRPDFGSCMSYTVPQFGVGLPVQLLTRRIRRFKGKLLVTALTGATSVIFNSNQDHLSIPQGYTLIAASFMPDWESQQPLYAIAIGGTANISVWDFSYAEA